MGINTINLNIRILFLITITFIINPTKGGRPPSEKNTKASKNLSYSLNVRKKRKFIFRGSKNNKPISIYIYININRIKTLFLASTASIIHIKLLILEKPKIFIILIVSILLTEITNLFRINKARIKLYFILKDLIITKGINFCNVDSKNKLCRLVIFIIIINQEWKGAIPNFKAIERINTLSILYLYLNILTIVTVINIIEAKLWTKKYFIVFSKGDRSLDDIIGRKLSMLTSRDTHIINLELLLKDKIKLIIIKE